MSDVDNEIQELESRLAALKKQTRQRRIELVLRVMDGERVLTEEIRQVPQISPEELMTLPVPKDGQEYDVELAAMGIVAEKIKTLPLAQMLKVLLARGRLKPAR